MSTIQIFGKWLQLIFQSLLNKKSSVLKETQNVVLKKIMTLVRSIVIKGSKTQGGKCWWQSHWWHSIPNINILLCIYSEFALTHKTMGDHSDFQPSHSSWGCIFVQKIYFLFDVSLLCTMSHPYEHFLENPRRPTCNHQ